jgi:ribosomal protein S18 acetylase RimI-like enzyme
MKYFIFGAKQYLKLALVTLIFSSLSAASTPKLAGTKRGAATLTGHNPALKAVKQLRPGRQLAKKSTDSPRSIGSERSFADKKTEVFTAPAGVIIRRAVLSDGEAIAALARKTLRTIFNPLIEEMNAAHPEWKEKSQEISLIPDSDISCIDKFNLVFLPLHECLVACDPEGFLMGFIIFRPEWSSNFDHEQTAIYDSSAEHMRHNDLCVLSPETTAAIKRSLPIKPCYAHIELIEVDAACTGKSIGTFLLNAMMDCVTGVNTVVLEVLFNNPAKKLYTELGFLADALSPVKPEIDARGYLRMTAKGRTFKSLLKDKLEKALAKAAGCHGSAAAGKLR